MGAKNVYFSVTNEAITVEEMVLSYYKEEFHYEGYHDEGHSLYELLVLLMWDFVYFPIPYAFQNEHQRIPIDFGTSAFYSIRKPFIENWFEQLSSLTDTQL